MKLIHIINAINTLGSLKYSKDPTKLILFYIKAKELVDKYHERVKMLSDKLSEGNSSKHAETLSFYEIGKEVDSKELKDAIAFNDSLTKAVKQLHNEDVDLEPIELDIDVIHKENSLTTEQGANIYALTKK